MPNMYNVSRKSLDILDWHLTPYQILALGFAGLIIAGTLLLMLPLASASGESLPFIDALFTATSAACVTGLTVVDTGTYFSLFGQLVIILLIQCGGLGIITMSTLMAILMRRKLQLKDRLVMKEALNHLTFSGIAHLVQYIVKIALFIEFVGGTILACRFFLDFGSTGIYYGYWHAISAFCNAGFDIIGANQGNLFVYVGDITVNLVLTSLIILGGLGFTQFSDLANRHSFTQFSFHTKVVLSSTFALIVIGTLGLFLLEFSNPETIGNIPLKDKILASYFQAVTVRTAGFCTIDIGAIGYSGLFLMIILMFIGASPGSCGGGIKTTSFTVIIVSIWNQIRGNEESVLFSRRISDSLIRRAFTICFISLLLVLGMTFVIITNEPNIHPVNIAFETVSAFSTTGLSTGITATLTSFSKFLLVLTMFIGRVGPVTFALALVLRSKKKTLHYPEGKISIG